MTFQFPSSLIRGLPTNVADAVEPFRKTRPPRRLAGAVAPAGMVAVPKRRQSLYAAETAERILGQLRDGRSLRAVCRDQGMPAASTVLQWVTDDRDDFAARYRRARQIGDAKTGQAPLYTAKIAQRILDELSSGRPLTHICSVPGMPSRGYVQLWAAQDRDGFAARYRRAKEVGGARPGPRSIYTADIADLVLDELSEGRSLADVCRDPGMPAHATVRQWVTEDRAGFAAPYLRARAFGWDAAADELTRIADDSRGDWIVRHNKDGSAEWVVNHANIRRSRLQISARRRLLSNAQPKKGGSWLDLRAHGED
jgi:hypothetical protein